MVERTLADEIISIVHSEANNNPLPLKCTIHETYSNGLIDVLLENGSILTYLPVIGSPRVGDTGVLLYLDDEKNNQIIITNGGDSGGGSTSVSWGNILNKPSTFPPSNHTHLSSDVTDLIDVIYPVGSIYMSVNSTSPQTLFGGTWEKIEDKFLLGSGATYANGSTGGSADAVVVSHNHSYGHKYVITTSGGPISKVSQAGGTGTKVHNLLQSKDGIYRNKINNSGEDGTGKNMPPYIAVNIWKRTA